MAEVFTSWKDIAQYLGKGVRTAQRWEQEEGLPVRRQNGDSGGRVLAFADEIDAWRRATTTQNSEERERLQLLGKIKQLLTEMSDGGGG